MQQGLARTCSFPHPSFPRTSHNKLAAIPTWRNCVYQWPFSKIVKVATKADNKSQKLARAELPDIFLPNSMTAWLLPATITVQPNSIFSLVMHLQTVFPPAQQKSCPWFQRYFNAHFEHNSQLIIGKETLMLGLGSWANSTDFSVIYWIHEEEKHFAFEPRQKNFVFFHREAGKLAPPRHATHANVYSKELPLELYSISTSE